MRLLATLALVALVPLTLPVSAQDAVPDTTDPATYYPLAVGNEWVYVRSFETAFRETVIGDSSVLGDEYFIVERSLIGSYDTNLSPDTTRFLVRFDAPSSQVVYVRPGEEPQTDGCPLDTDFPTDPRDERPITCGGESATLTGGYEQYVPPALAVGDGFVATTKTFHLSDDTNVRYAAGVGPVSADLRLEGDTYAEERLVRAQIDGEEYGFPLHPDPTDPESYYPLTVGNEWEYLRRVHPDVTRTHRIVTRDTVVSGTSYVEMRTFLAGETVTDWGEGTSQLLRFDPTTARIVERMGADSEVAVTCSFASAFGEIIGCSGNEMYLGPVGLVFGELTPREILVGGDRVFVSATKVFYDLGIGFTDTGSLGGYGAGVGPLPQTDFAFCSAALCSEKLTFLRIVEDDGTVREYGARFAVVAEDSPELTALSLHAFPTPTPGPLALTLDVPTPGAVTFEAFDALGRRVWHRETALGAGRQRLDVDASAWAPGLYIVRVTAGDATATARVVRR